MKFNETESETAVKIGFSFSLVVGIFIILFNGGTSRYGLHGRHSMEVKVAIP